MTNANPTPLPPTWRSRRGTQRRGPQARSRQPHIAGGGDPELEETLRRERPYVQILIAMVVIIVLTGFVLGFIGAIITAPRT